MNSLKDYLHLVANGKFQCLYEHLGREYVSTIEGIENNGLIIRMAPLKNTRTVHFEYCTLIARKIDGMSDEEISLFHSGVRLNKKGRERAISSLREFNDLSSSVFLKLLELGIYPGPQSHFDLPDGNPNRVIDKEGI